MTNTFTIGQEVFLFKRLYTNTHKRCKQKTRQTIVCIDTGCLMHVWDFLWNKGKPMPHDMQIIYTLDNGRRVTELAARAGYLQPANV